MKRSACILLLSLMVLFSLSAQDIFWENAKILVPEKALFPQVVHNQDQILIMWQEVNADRSSYRLRFIRSYDGIIWTDPQDVSGFIPFLMEQDVSLFSLAAGRDGDFLLALTRDARSILTFYSADGSEFTARDVIEGEHALLSPRLFQDNLGDPILFLTENIEASDEVIGGIHIVYTDFRNGEWSPLTELVQGADLNLNLLPYYHRFGNYEYVVFQSLFSGQRITWQLYMQRRLLGTTEWEPVELITDFSDNPDRIAEYYSNQRPHLIDDGTQLLMAWERNYTLESPQVYMAPLDTMGRIIQGEVKTLTRGFRYNAYPRLFNYKDNLYVSWFDNRQELQTVFSDVNFSFRGGELLSNIAGSSSYPHPIVFKDELYFIWENTYLDRNRLVLLAPDKSVSTPLITPVGFKRGERRREQMVTFNWRQPRDSSGIRTYRFSWNRDALDHPGLNEEASSVPNPQALTFQATEDGYWYFHLSAQDNAGNWSEPQHFPYFRDRTPPSPVQFEFPRTDEWGNLLSNSEQLRWLPPPEEDVAGYSYTLNYLGAQFPNPEQFPVTDPQADVTQLDPFIRLRNQDNGWWSLSVVAIDSTGNVSIPSRKLFRLNKYIPVTYISWVISERDSLDRIRLRITGRGFAVGGNIERVILDRDGIAPYDYVYYLNQDFTVTGDRYIDGPLISIIEKGIYRIAVEHPQRGRVWSRRQLSIDSTGTVKYGDFTRTLTPLWNRLQDPALRMVFNDWTLYLLLALLALTAFVAGGKALQYYKESRNMEINAKALIQNRLFYSETLLEEARQMKKRGLKLRAKFTLALLSLVISVVLIVALFLGRYMINSQQLSLGEELEKRSALLVNTLVTGGQSYLPTKQRIELRQLPGQIAAMEEALHTTLVGIGNNDPENYNYIWSSNDPEINEKQALPAILSDNERNRWLENLDQDAEFLSSWYQLSDEGWVLREEPDRPYQELAGLLFAQGLRSAYTIGETVYQDEISLDLQRLEKEINEKAIAEIGDLKEQYEDLSNEARRLAARTDRAAAEDLENIQNTLSMIRGEINQVLLNISADTGVLSYPYYDPENLASLSLDEREYTFYKPILYNDPNSNDYYKGAVRLTITVTPLIEQLQLTRIAIYRITGITFLAAIIIGFTGALLLSSSMTKPIKELAAHVQVIIETEDKKKLKNHIYPIKSSDEIGELGIIINNMTHGLVEAAEANEDLMAGKDMQKAFIPLDVSKLDQKKHTTGHYEDDDVLIFGYYEGAKAVSGDYFDFRQLDDEHFAIIKCDIAGKGVAASLIMVEVATIFVNYFRSHKPKEQGVDLADLVWTINDLLNEVGFSGRFAAFNVLLLNKRTGQTWMCHAGDREVNMYDSSTGKMFTKMLNDVPAAGSVDSDMLKMQNMEYIQAPHMMKHNDMIFLYTDGIEEAQNLFRNSNFEQITCDGSCGATENDPGSDEHNHTNHIMGETFEEFTTTRVFQVIEAVINKQEFILTKYHDPLGLDHQYTFDYRNGSGSADEAVLALIAAQFMFQLIPDPNAGELDRVIVDKKVDEYMKIHLKEYREYFKYPVENPENPEYIYYSHLKKDSQTDDLTILAIRKK